MSVVKDNSTYVMYNKVTKVRIECKKSVLVKWLALGFEIEKIIPPTK